MKNIVFGGCMVLALAAGVSAQGMMKPENAGGRGGTATTLSGCVERTSEGGFQLTHVTPVKGKGAAPKTGKAMKDGGSEAMSHDDMPMPDTMKDKGMAHDAMSGDGMWASPLTLSTKSVDLAKHLGQRVSVSGSSSGMSDMPSFAVTSIKTVAKSCR